MKGGIAIIFLLLLLPVKAFEQGLEVYGSIGAGKCNMQELKDLQQSTLYSLGIPEARIADDFPVTLHYTGDVRWRFNRLSAGLSYYFLTSGSRICYSDYSGELNFDIIASAHSFGPSLSYALLNIDRFTVNSSINSLFSFSRVSFVDYLKIYDESETSELKTSSTSFGILPAVEACYNLSRLHMGIRMGYLLDTKGFLHEEFNRKYYLVDKNGEKVRTSWTGYNLDFIVGYTFSVHQRNDRPKISLQARKFLKSWNYRNIFPWIIPKMIP